jgi:hypothetical protein
MTSEGPYPPGYEPADGAPPVGRRGQESYPGPDALPGRASASVRVPQPDEWSTPPGGQAAPQGGFGNAYPNQPGTYGAQPPSSGPGTQSPFAPPETSMRIPSAPGVYGSPGGPSQYGAAQPHDAGDQTRVGSPYQAGYEQAGYEQAGYEQAGYEGSAPRVDEQQPGAGQTYGAPPAKKSRRGLIIGVVIAVVVVVVLGAVGGYLAFSGGGSSNFPVGSCVKHSGDQATSVDCSASDAFKITSTTDSPTKCPDQAQPYVVLQRSGAADQVLCLKPAH